MKAKTIHVHGLGSILLEKSSRAKHLNISVKPPAKIRVAVPFWISYEKAEIFARSKTNWINNNLIKISTLMKKHGQFKPIDREHAGRYLAKRIHELALQNGFTYNNLYIKNQKTRWGSCSSKNNINLNINLLHLPKELCDYVIMHELVHTKVKNHSFEFWNMLNEYVGDAKEHNEKLKQYGLLLF